MYHSMYQVPDRTAGVKGESERDPVLVRVPIQCVSPTGPQRTDYGAAYGGNQLYPETRHEGACTKLMQRECSAVCSALQARGSECTYSQSMP